MQFQCAIFLMLMPIILVSGIGRPKPHSKIMYTVERVYEKYANHLLKFEKSLKLQTPSKVSKFIWSSCSGPDPLAHIDELDISEPLSIPGNVTITVNSNLRVDIKAPLKVAVQVQKKVGFLWVDVPCVDNVGSCNYDDLCSLIPFPPGKPCPEPFLSLELPCNCPVPQGNYVIQNKVVHIPDEHIPQFLARGQYNVRVQASMNDQEVICFKSTFALM